VTPRSISHAQKLLLSQASKLPLAQAQDLLRSAYRHARQPSRLTLGVGAATLATVGGVWGGLAATGSPAVATAAAAAQAPAVAGHNVSAASPSAAAPASSAHPASQAAPAEHASATQSAHPGTAGQAEPTAAASHGAAAVHTARPAGHVTVTAHTAKAAAAATPQAGSDQHAAAPTQPYTIYDSVTPAAIPQGQEVATYATGPFAVQASQVAGRKVLWIDTQGTDPNAAALDVEPGDATPAVAANWVQEKLTAHPRYDAIIYTMQSEWPAAQSAIAGLPDWMQHHIRWWIADPTGVPHVVPGASATQWYWGSNYDITTANPGF
jgi:hypothetical protein